MNTRRNRNRRRLQGRPRSQLQGSASVTGQLQQINKSLSDLLLATSDHSLPPKRDVQPMKLTSKTHTFSRTSDYGVVTIGATAYLSGYNFALNQFPNYAEFTALFDQYRIRQIVVEFIPNKQEGTYNPGVSNTTYIASAIDYDDSTNPTSVSDIMQYDTYEVVPLGQYFKRTLVPHCTTAAYSGTFTSYTVERNDLWLDAASPGIQYYGLKVVVPAQTGASTIENLYRVQVTAMLQFRTVH